jgi:hypothetical protein
MTSIDGAPALHMPIKPPLPAGFEGSGGLTRSS